MSGHIQYILQIWRVLFWDGKQIGWPDVTDYIRSNIGKLKHTMDMTTLSGADRFSINFGLSGTRPTSDIATDYELADHPRVYKNSWNTQKPDHDYCSIRDYLGSLPNTTRTATETSKKVVIVHTHYNYFSQLHRYFQQFYIYGQLSRFF